MTEHEFAGVRLAAFVAAAIVAVTLERVTPHRRLRGNGRTNLSLWAAGVVTMGIVCGTCAFTVAMWAQSAGVGLLRGLQVPGWMNVAASVLTLDLLSYGWHRGNHQIAILWRFHRVHHSDAVFNVFTGLRFHPGELLLALPVRLAAVVLLGVSVPGVILFEALFTLANLVEHGDIDVPTSVEERMGRLLILPAIHRWHHCRQWPELDTNFGTIFVFWDRLFGTYRANDSATSVETGLPGMAQAPTLLEAILMPLQGTDRTRAAGRRSTNG